MTEPPTDACEACGEPLLKEEYAPLLRYASQAVYYGYDYRLEYEEQVNEDGRVNCKYSLPQPNDLWEVLAVAIVGGVAYDMFKYIKQQIINFLTGPPVGTNPDYDRMLSVITDSDKLKQFVTYIQEYHERTMDTPKPVIDAIDEEKRADWNRARVQKITSELLAKGEELTPQKMGAIAAQAMREMFSEGIEPHYEGPSHEQLDSVLQSLKRRTEALTNPNGDELKAPTN